jgi:hypothetical protein
MRSSDTTCSRAGARHAFAGVHNRSANLVLVCSRHHTLIHTQGFQLRLHPDRRLDVRTADGARIVHHPAQPWGDPAALATGCGQLVSAEALPPDRCDTRLDLHYAVSVLIAQAA